MYRLQPIYNILTKKVHAYEILFNGKCGAANVRSWNNFDLFMFDQILPKITINSIEKVRVNVNLTSESAMLINDRHIEVASKNFLLVIEWNEKSFDHIDNDAVAKKLSHWRDTFGIEVVFDDVCSDQCFLRKMALIKPDMIKLDGTVFKKSLTEESYGIVAKVAKYSCTLIGIPFLVEWIETENELDHAINTLGAEFGQGYLMDGWQDDMKKNVLMPEISEEKYHEYVSLLA